MDPRDPELADATEKIKQSLFNGADESRTEDAHIDEHDDETRFDGDDEERPLDRSKPEPEDGSLAQAAERIEDALFGFGVDEDDDSGETEVDDSTGIDQEESGLETPAPQYSPDDVRAALKDRWDELESEYKTVTDPARKKRIEAEAKRIVELDRWNTGREQAARTHKEEMQILMGANPQWKDPKVAKREAEAMIRAGMDLGYSREQLDSARAQDLIALRKIAVKMGYIGKGKGLKRGERRPVRIKGQTVRKKTKSKRSNVQLGRIQPGGATRNISESRQRLRETGTQAAAAEYFERRFKGER